MKEEYRVQNQLEFEERLKEEDEEDINSDGFSHEENKVEDVEEMNNSSLMDKVDEDDRLEISKIAEELKE